MSSHSNRNPDDRYPPNNDIKPVPITTTTTTTTTTISSVGSGTTNGDGNSKGNVNGNGSGYGGYYNPNTNNHSQNNPNHQTNQNNQNNQNPRGRRGLPRHRRSGTPSLSRSRSRSRSRSIHDSVSRSPSPKPGRPNPINRHHDHRDRDRDHRMDRKRSGGGGSRSYHGRRNKRHTRELPYPSRSRSNSRSRSRSMSRSKSRSPFSSNDSDDGRRHRRHRTSRPNRDSYHKHRDRQGHRWRDNENHHHHHNGNAMRNRHGNDRLAHTMNHDGDHHVNNGRNSGRNNHHNRDGHAMGRDDTNGISSGYREFGGNAMDKTPVSFKEFTNRMLDDDATPQEAQRRYEKYLQRFSKSDDVLFFEAHKDEEWFQERYDPIFIEKSIENRRQNARDQYWTFYEQFLCDELPEVHDNIKDFKDTKESTLLGHRSASPSRSPPAINTKTDNNDTVDPLDAKGEGLHSTKTMKTEISENGKDSDVADGSHPDGSVPTTTINMDPSVPIKEDPADCGGITTTVIGGGDHNADVAPSGDQVEGQPDKQLDERQMEVDEVERGNSQNSGVPRDGKVRLPKYADIMFKDDYEPKMRAGWSGSWNRAECYENSVFIQGIPLHIQREKIMKLFEKRRGFEKLILSDPIRNARKVRYGWVTFVDQESCREVLKSQEEGGLNGYNLTLQYTMNLLPKQRSKRKPKFSPPESLYPHRVRKDLEKATECARKFDAEAGIVDNPLLKESLLAQLSPIRRLNLMLLYLRKIHFLCYYCGKHFLSEEHLFARCSGMHERKVPADPSLAMSGNIDIDEHTESGQIIKKDQTNWERELDQRIHDVVHYVMDHKHSWVERKQVKMQEKHTKRVSENKFRCTICSKLFKAEQYVTKHIGNKHQMDIAKYIADQRLRTMFENYRRDRDRLTLKSFEVSEDGNGPRNRRNDGNRSKMGNGGGGGMGMGMRGQHPLSRMGNYGPNPMMMAPYGHMMAYPSMMGPGGRGSGGGGGGGGGPGPGPANGPIGPGTGPPMGSGFSGPDRSSSTRSTANGPSGTNPGDQGPGNGAMHPERESNLSGHHGAGQQQNMGRNAAPFRRRGDFEDRGRRGDHMMGGMMRPQFQEPRGRQMRVHVPEGPTRTRRSYREVDIEFPEAEAEEEIDYGFGDFDKNPTKFNL